MSVVCIVALLLPLSGCKVYSFTGASVPADVKTVTVETIRNLAANGPVSLNQTLTDKLKQKFVTEASLTQVNTDGDLVFKGSITSYTFSSQAPTAQVQSGVNRLTITIQMSYTNKKYPKDSWKTPETFSRFADVPGTSNLNDVQDQLIADISKQLIDDVFNKALVKW
ncbi:MAG: LptE family protein [Bacteroidetes bacterium]|nr:LptE family protein [Bacteroidota bacterium]MBS1683805.1 LptE family protein [Bacteroidota bacterium]